MNTMERQHTILVDREIDPAIREELGSAISATFTELGGDVVIRDDYDTFVGSEQEGHQDIRVSETPDNKISFETFLRKTSDICDRILEEYSDIALKTDRYANVMIMQGQRLGPG